jgi:anti-anti-sigma factor
MAERTCGTMPAFEIAQDSLGQTCVVHLSGDIDMAVVPDLKDGLGAALSGGCGNVVLDLTDVDYADSTALGLLVWLDHQLGPRGGRLVLAGANPDVQRILELSGLVSVAASIATSSDVAAALAGLELTDTPNELLWREDIQMVADVDSLAEVRERVCGIVAPLGFTESALFDIKVALGEALANAVRHGSSTDAEANVDVGVTAYEDRVIIEVSDSGVGFDGTPKHSEDLYAPSGRGIMFMRALMDRVEFESPESGGTKVRLVKHRGSGVG